MRRAYRIAVYYATATEPAYDEMKPEVSDDESREFALERAVKLIRKAKRKRPHPECKDGIGWTAVVEPGWMLQHRVQRRGLVFKVDPFEACLIVGADGTVGTES